MIRCNGCQRVKSRKQFPKSKCAPNGVSTHCKECNNKKGAIYRMRRRAECAKIRAEVETANIRWASGVSLDFQLDTTTMPIGYETFPIIL